MASSNSSNLKRKRTVPDVLEDPYEAARACLGVMPVCFSANAIYSLEESRDGLRDLLKQLRTTNASMRAELEELERVTASLNALPSLANVASLVQLADGDKYALDSITAASHTAEAVPTTSSSSGSEGADVPASTSPEPASV